MEEEIPILAHVEVAIGQPETVFNLEIDSPFAFQESNCSYPISFLDVVLQGGHLFCLYFG